MMDFVQNLQDVVAVREIRNHYRGNVHFRERSDPFTMYDEVEFRRRYRLSKATARFVVNLLKEDLVPITKRKMDVSPELQVLVTLRFFAKGCYQLELGDLHGISQPTVSNIIKRVAEAIARHRSQFIVWPSRIQDIKLAFYQKAQFPGVVGCVDCTHIKVRNPFGAQPLLYCNRKGFYSLNVQVICDASTRITNIVARWRGSAHDSRIWANSLIKSNLESGQKKGLILGDSGYPCTRYLLTPLLRPQNPAEEQYNRAHKSTRVTVECCFGRWKGMFRALQNGLQVSLNTAKSCIVAMAILYNIKLEYDDDDFQYDNDEEEDDHSENEDAVFQIPHVQNQGNAFRRSFIQEHFNAYNIY